MLLFTRAEQSGFTETSRLADVQRFLDTVLALDGAETFERSTFGHSRDGRPLELVRVPALGDEGGTTLRVLVLANIHGGEVCGKEAVQILLRELAAGEHQELREGVELWLAPIYNVDGNERITTTNRSNVNGPVGGLGERANAESLDLNRDFIKVTAPETASLLALLDRIDPHVFYDLHTTNGADHAFHLTYAASLSPNAPASIRDYLNEEHFPGVRERCLETHTYRVFDYGNFPPDDRSQYATFDHRPRFATNYVGLRNRLAILSEAYAYEPFEVRVRATRAFVLESLRGLQRDRERVVELCETEDRVAERGAALFRTQTILADGWTGSIPTRPWDPLPVDGGTRRMRRSEITRVQTQIRVGFTAQDERTMPAEGWWLPASVHETVTGTLQKHGVRVEPTNGANRAIVQRFVPVSQERAERPFQGVHTV
ncbi:MAG: M14 family metallopeptidase, partial [Myxococcota bacterium]